jgi:predicted nucleic acid-binding protein
VKYLLDINALLAAIWRDHTSHPVADRWVMGKSLATCALSELGFLRISTHPRALGASMSDARVLLRDFLAKHQVEFVPADLPVLGSKAGKSDDLTDFYLADLAANRQMRFATLDSKIRHPAVELIN